MRVAMIGQKGIPAIYGGIERHVEELSSRLVKSGQNVTVYSRKWYQKEIQTEYKGINIAFSKGIHSKHLDAITHTFTATLDAIRGKFDVIHYHGVGPSLLSFIPRIFAPKTKIISTFHCIDRYHQKWGFIAKSALRLGEWAACKFAHETIVVSKNLREYCANEFEKDCEYIPNGITPKTEKIDSKLLDKFGLQSGEYFVMISRLVKHKGAHILIEAFNKLKEDLAGNPEIDKLKLAIVGGSAFTDKYIKNLAKLASKNNTIVFTDFQSGDELETLYTHAKALVHPSLNEGLPITVLEAMSYETPVLVSNIPEHQEVVLHIDALFEKNDVASLAEAMKNFVSKSEEQRNELASKHKCLVNNEYNWDKIAQNTIELYKKEKVQIKRKLAMQA